MIKGMNIEGSDRIVRTLEVFDNKTDGLICDIELEITVDEISKIIPLTDENDDYDYVYCYPLSQQQFFALNEFSRKRNRDHQSYPKKILTHFDDITYAYFLDCAAIKKPVNPPRHH